MHETLYFKIFFKKNHFQSQVNIIYNLMIVKFNFNQYIIKYLNRKLKSPL